jgi:hypothetical protein
MTVFPVNVFMWIDWFVTGYGYYPSRVVWSIAFFVALGLVVLYATGEHTRVFVDAVDPADRSALSGLVYSIDMLVPIFTLRRANANVELRGCARVYFYVHRVAGVILASLLAAALATMVTK